VNPIIVIPARLASTRLPDKPLALIHRKPMILHVLERAQKAAVGPVVVACGDRAIKEAVEAGGGRAVMTDPALPSGSDRVWAAVRKLDPRGRHDIIINLQGDAPDLSRAEIRAVLEPLRDRTVDISTLVAPLDARRVKDENTVKAAAALAPGKRVGYALYFSRAPIPSGEGPRYHHIGIYGYRRDALARFVKTKQGVLERREKLEQLRALEAGMRIAVRLIDRVPLEVNTPADLRRANRLMRA
jgi:3-deoxy-manno-octulosonate cytidylyltransferase (CMP-KDO synthetase)